jgi:hypothetical protein
MKRLSFAFLLAAALAACTPGAPQVADRTIEVTRIVESTRLVEVTRIVEITAPPGTPVVIVVTPTAVPGPIQVQTKLALFWVSIAQGQVNIKITNESDASIAGLDYHCIVVGKRTGAVLADETLSVDAIPAGETELVWFQFVPKSENIPGYFQVNCESQNVDPVTAQFYNPGGHSSLPGRPSSNGTSACTLALDNLDRAVDTYVNVKSRYDRGQASYDELVGAYLIALGAYYNAVAACG